MFDANTRFEIMADAFYRETGQLAPGKDAVLLSESAEERRAHWDDWTVAYGRVINHIFAATELFITDDLPALRAELAAAKELIDSNAERTEQLERIASAAQEFVTNLDAAKIASTAPLKAALNDVWVDVTPAGKEPQQ